MSKVKNHPRTTAVIIPFGSEGASVTVPHGRFSFKTNKVECSIIPNYVLEHNYVSIKRSVYQPGGYGKKRHHGETRDIQHHCSLKLGSLSSKNSSNMSTHTTKMA